MAKSPDPIIAGLISKTQAAIDEITLASQRQKAADAEAAAAKELRDRGIANFNAVREAAKVFDVDFEQFFADHFLSKGDQAASNETSTIPIHGEGAKPVREFVLALAEAAYPSPVRAAEMRVELEKQRGGTLHEKTIGMTLYRLSKDGFMRREGQKDWFYVPPEERAKNPGGETPGNFDLVGEEGEEP